MALTEGAPVEVTHETLDAAASDTLPQQRDALGSTKQTITSRQVPEKAFSELGAEASAGHHRNITEIADRMTGADKRYAAVIQGIGDTTKRFREFDEEQTGRQKDQNVQLAAARRRRQAVSQNGWPVNPSRSWRTVPGSGVRLNLVDGPAGDLLNHVAGQVHQRVESINLQGNDGPDDWGYANRPIRGGTATSNHASGTAFDFNADRHPLGAANTWTRAQVDEIHRILGEVDNVVRWGGDYRGRLDEMHFEIDASPAEVSRVWDRIRQEIERTP